MKPRKITISLKLRWQRFVLRTSLVLASIAGCVGYFALLDIGQSKAWKLTAWGGSRAVAPLVTGLPWFFWAWIAALALYLWWKHKLLMSVVYAALFGAVLALV